MFDLDISVCLYDIHTQITPTVNSTSLLSRFTFRNRNKTYAGEVICTPDSRCPALAAVARPLCSARSSLPAPTPRERVPPAASKPRLISDVDGQLQEPRRRAHEHQVIPVLLCARVGVGAPFLFLGLAGRRLRCLSPGQGQPRRRSRAAPHEQQRVRWQRRRRALVRLLVLPLVVVFFTTVVIVVSGGVLLQRLFFAAFQHHEPLGEHACGGGSAVVLVVRGRVHRRAVEGPDEAARLEAEAPQDAAEERQRVPPDPDSLEPPSRLLPPPVHPRDLLHNGDPALPATSCSLPTVHRPRRGHRARLLVPADLDLSGARDFGRLRLLLVVVPRRPLRLGPAEHGARPRAWCL
jgi:hypothetical protein